LPGRKNPPEEILCRTRLGANLGANLSGQFCLFPELFEFKKGGEKEGSIFEVTGVPSKIALSYSGGRNY